MKTAGHDGAADAGPREAGAAMVEFAVVFPLQLLIFLLGIQLCLIVVGKMVVNHAAFCAARAELVGEDPVEAAVIACIPIGGVATDGVEAAPVVLPGWEGSAPDLDVLSMRAREKLNYQGLKWVEVIEPSGGSENRVVVRVRFPFEMMIPLANWVIYYALEGMNPGLVHFDPVSASGSGPDDSDLARAIATTIGDIPHLIIQEEGIVTANWPSPTQDPHDIVTEPEEAE